MHADSNGAPVLPVRPLDRSVETLQRLRDLIMVRYAATGLSQHEIAIIMNVSQQTVSRRIRGIPPHVRERYSKQALDKLG